MGLGRRLSRVVAKTFLGVEVSDSGGGSTIDVWTALTRSVNTVVYKMGIDTGPQRVVDAPIRPVSRRRWPSWRKPTARSGWRRDKEVRPVDIASAFATFAADGVRHDAYVVSKVTAADGRVIYDHGVATGAQAVPQAVARNVTEAMSGVPAAQAIAVADDRDQAGVTGEAPGSGKGDNNTDAWMVGYTPSVATAVWIGTDGREPIRNAQGAGRCTSACCRVRSGRTS